MASRADVLIIDDSLVDLRVLMELMTLRDLRFSVARDGERGYQQALVLQPGLILLDIRMPRMDGYTVCRRLKANPQTAAIPVIFLTAATDLGERLEGFAAGGVDFITKPFAAEEVLARVGVHLELAARRRSALADAAETSAAVEAQSVTSLDEVLVTAAQKILRDSIVTPPSLEQLARLVGTNRRRLNESFQGFLGQPVFGWLREERLRQAYEFAARTDMTVAAISDSLGYSTAANFTKAFRERFGVTPSELRLRREAGTLSPPPPHPPTPRVSARRRQSLVR
jgi:DNA-binding response OmpR family regulator